MKSLIRLLSSMIIFFSLITLIGCINSTSSDKKDIREIVWDQLSKETKYDIIGDWQDGVIEKIIIPKNTTKYALANKNYEGKEVYLITFKSKSEDLLGNIELLVDINSIVIVGNGVRE